LTDKFSVDTLKANQAAILNIQLRNLVNKPWMNVSKDLQNYFYKESNTGHMVVIWKANNDKVCDKVKKKEIKKN
jgi:hypothetical protein